VSAETGVGVGAALRQPTPKGSGGALGAAGHASHSTTRGPPTPPLPGWITPVCRLKPIGLELRVAAARDGKRSDATNYLGGVADVLEDKGHRGALQHLGDLAAVALYDNDRQIEEAHYYWEEAASPSYRVKFWTLA
jgi:hypothetical protein